MPPVGYSLHYCGSFYAQHKKNRSNVDYIILSIWPGSVAYIIMSAVLG